MPTTHSLSTADVRDRHANLLAFGVLLLGIKYAADATMHFVSARVAGVLDVGGSVLALSAVVLLLTISFWKARNLPAGERRTYFSPDGFIANVVNRAHIASWAATLFLLIGFEVISKDLQNLPAEFFLQTTLAGMLSTFSIAFFILNRDAINAGAEEPSSA